MLINGDNASFDENAQNEKTKTPQHSWHTCNHAQ
jgi:hypothetical protein